MYNLINTYSVPTPPEDMIVFATLPSSINFLRTLIDEAVLDREASMDELCTSLTQGHKAAEPGGYGNQAEVTGTWKTFVTYLHTY